MNMYVRSKRILTIIILIGLIGLAIFITGFIQLDNSLWWFLALLPSCILMTPAVLLLKTAMDNEPVIRENE